MYSLFDRGIYHSKPMTKKSSWKVVYSKVRSKQLVPALEKKWFDLFDYICTLLATSQKDQGMNKKLNVIIFLIEN